MRYRVYDIKLQKIILSMLHAASHHGEGNACFPIQWFCWFYSDWFSTFRLSLTIQSQILSLMNRKFQTTQSLEPPIGKQFGPPFQFLSFQVWYGCSSHSIFIDFFMLTQFFTIQLSSTLCWLESRTVKTIWLEVQLRKILMLNWIFLTWHGHDHSVFNNTSVSKNISFWCQTTDGLLNSGQLEYHIFITAINIPAHHRDLHHHMCTLQTSAVQLPHAAAGHHDERCRAEAQTREERRAETQEKHEWKTPQYSLLKFFCRSLRVLDELYQLSGFDC